MNVYGIESSTVPTRDSDSVYPANRETRVIMLLARWQEGKGGGILEKGVEWAKRGGGARVVWK